MSMLEKKSFSAPDETRSLPKTKLEVVTFGDMSAAKGTFEPGWRWSEHVKPKAGTESCQVFHFGYVLSGRQHVVMDDGREAEFGPGDVVVVSPGHDAWVVGDEPYVALDFQGGKTYAQEGNG